MRHIEYNYKVCKWYCGKISQTISKEYGTKSDSEDIAKYSVSAAIHDAFIH